jgi:DNA polymerase I-like protein with 3'-5' exonuclease and polymerase domains
MNLVFDIETDGLDASVIWCIVAKDIDTKQVYSFSPSNIEEGIELLAKSKILIGHNILGFDIPVLEKLTDISFKNKKIIDTLVLSRLANPERDGHGLKAWGFKLNYHKGLMQEEDFKEYTPEMLEYCINDVELNALVFQALLTELTDFDEESIKLEHQVAKILKDQENYGFMLDVEKAHKLLATLKQTNQEIVEEVHKVFLPKKVKLKTVVPKFKKDGTLSKQGLTEEEYECYSQKHPTQVLAFDRYKIQDFNLNSRKQIGEYLQDFGWKPKKFTPTGQPIVDESTLNAIEDISQAKLISEFLLLNKRVALVDSWFKNLKGDRVHGYAVHNGAVTGRMTHFKPNMAQIPATYSPYGKDCRSCWTVPEGYKLVGIDASGLELRMLAHYMNDRSYTNEVLNGDIHTANQKLAGLESRDKSKKFIYAYLYGAGNERLGSVVGGSRKDGKRLRESFLANLPALANLKDRVERASKRGFLKGLDGRKVTIRSEHAALNTLLQSAGAIIMKKALVLFVDSIKHLDAQCVANVHDEWQVECLEKDAEEVGQRGVQAIVDAGIYFDLRCPLDGEYKIGDNWSDTH